jgi:hypothetical protein
MNTTNHNGARITADEMHQWIDSCEKVQPGFRAYLSFSIGERVVKMSGDFMAAEELHAAVCTAANLGGEMFTMYEAGR